jgi:hypothetical protein
MKEVIVPKLKQVNDPIKILTKLHTNMRNKLQEAFENSDSCTVVRLANEIISERAAALISLGTIYKGDDPKVEKLLRDTAKISKNAEAVALEAPKTEQIITAFKESISIQNAITKLRITTDNMVLRVEEIKAKLKMAVLNPKADRTAILEESHTVKLAIQQTSYIYLALSARANSVLKTLTKIGSTPKESAVKMCITQTLKASDQASRMWLTGFELDQCLNKAQLQLTEIIKKQNNETAIKEKIINEKLKKIGTILTNLSLKISESKVLETSEAKGKAIILINDLSHARDKFQKNLNIGKNEKTAGEQFIIECNSAIQAALPELEKDITLANYLKNIAIWLLNIVITGINKAGGNLSFFSPVQSQSSIVVQKTKHELAEEIAIPLFDKDVNTYTVPEEPTPMLRARL